MAPSKQPSLKGKVAPPSTVKKTLPSPEANAAKKHPKKQPKKHAGKHEKGKHLRRAYEHLGRVEALQAIPAVQADASIALLLQEAQRAIRNGDSHSAADLLRAAEHLGFATASANPAQLPPLTPELEQALVSEFEKKAGKVTRHAAPTNSPIASLALQSLEAAHIARGRRSFREAMEFIRAAEALAEIARDGYDALPQASGKLPELPA